METPRLHKRRRLNRNPFVDNTAHDSNVDESSDESLVDPEIWPDDDGGEEPPGMMLLFPCVPVAYLDMYRICSVKTFSSSDTRRRSSTMSKIG